MLLNTLIVDDEEFARSSLYFLLQQNCPQLQIVGIAKSVAEAKAYLAQHVIDLVFLDIAMPGESGFDLIPHLNTATTKVVFTTAYDNYALRAIKANALDYLMKPIDIEELVLAAEKAIEAKKNNQPAVDVPLNNLNENLASGDELKKLTLPSGQGYRVVELNQIVFIEADSNYSIFHLMGGETLAVSKVLKDYEEILPETAFVRVHKSTIINLNFVAEYQSKNGSSLLLKNGHEIAISRRRAADFHDRLKAFTLQKNTRD